jgi:hypothetical protein
MPIQIVFLRNEAMIRIECSSHSNDWSRVFSDRRKYELSKVKYSFFESGNILFQLKNCVELDQGANDCEFVLRENDEEESAHFFRNTIEEIRQLLRQSGGSGCENRFTFFPPVFPNCVEIGHCVERTGERELNGMEKLDRISFSSESHLKEIYGFGNCRSLSRIELPSSLEIIGEFGFYECTSLNEITFSQDSHLKTIQGIRNCRSLCRIELTSSREIIGKLGFYECTSLNEIIFPLGSHLKEINGIQNRKSLYRIELPSSSEIVRGFFGCSQLRIIMVGPGCRVKDNTGIRNRRPFVVHEDQDVKDSRRLIHLGLFGSKA